MDGFIVLSEMSVGERQKPYGFIRMESGNNNNKQNKQNKHEDTENQLVVNRAGGSFRVGEVRERG